MNDSNGSGLSVADVAALNGNGCGFGNGFEGLIYLAVIASMFGNGNWFGNNSRGTDDALLAATLANQNANNGFANAIGYENLATSNEVQRGFDNQNSMANQREILAAVNAQGQAGINATNQTFHDTVSVLSDKYSELARDVAGLAVGQSNAMANQNSCCCDIKQLVQGTAADTAMQVAQNRYDAALGIAGVNSGIAQNKYENALGLAGISSQIAQNRYENALNTASIKEDFTAQIQSVKDMYAQDKIDALQNEVNNLRFRNELQSATAGVVKYPMNTYYSVPSPCFSPSNCCGNII